MLSLFSLFYFHFFLFRHISCLSISFSINLSLFLCNSFFFYLSSHSSVRWLLSPSIQRIHVCIRRYMYMKLNTYASPSSSCSHITLARLTVIRWNVTRMFLRSNETTRRNYEGKKTREKWRENARRKAREGNDEKNIKWEKGVVDQKRGIRYVHFSAVNQAKHTVDVRAVVIVQK